MRNLLLFGVICILLTNCTSPTYMVKFEEPKPDMVTTEDLRSFLNSKDEIKVVLRTPATNNNSTDENTYSPIFNTIEKELLKAGFIVRDKSIFNVVSQSAERTNYSELQEQTDTDLIIELVDFDTKVPYTTNTYYDDGEKKTFQFEKNITAYGANAEFRIVLLEDNQFAGSYSFNYAPCKNGCPIKIASGNYEPSFVERKVDEEINDNPYQFVSKPALEQFMKNATSSLINEIR